MDEVQENDENRLIFPLYVGDVSFDIEIEESNVKWTKRGENITQSPSKCKKSVARNISNSTIEWRYILSAQYEQSGPTLEIFFIEKKPKNIWIKSSQKFQGIEVNCRECAQAIRQRLDQVKGRPRNLLVFVNPVSGSAKNGVKIHKTQVAPLLQLANIASEAIVTQHAGHAKEYIQEHDLSQYDGVVIVGGDGTFTEAFTGLLLKTAQAAALNIHDQSLQWLKSHLHIGIVPAGTGQGMVKGATGSKDVTTAVLHIITGSVFDIPCLTVHNGGKFLATGSMLAAIGFFGDSIRDSEAKRSLGILRYPYGMLKTMVNHRQIPLDVRYLATVHHNRADKSSAKRSNNNTTNHSKDTAPNHQPSTSSTISDSSTASPKISEHVSTETHETGAGDSVTASALPDVENAMETVDINASHPADNWVTQSGTYRGVQTFLINIAAAKLGEAYEDGGLDLTLVKGAAGRIRHMGAILKSFDIISSEINSDIAEYIAADHVELTLRDHTEESLLQLSRTDRREVINVDGDPFTLLHPHIVIRKHFNVMSMYGEHGLEPFKW